MLLILKSHVAEYTKKDGTFVAAHEARHQQYARMFSPSLGIRREDMPQIPGGVKQKFLDELMAAGVSIERATVDPAELRPTQSTYNASNMDYLTAEARAGRFDSSPILVSQDGRVLDGHHRWAVAALEGKQLPIIKIGMLARELLSTAKKFNTENGIEARGTKGGPTMAKCFGRPLLALKSHVGPYLRRGKLVNLTGYQGRQARAQPAEGQQELFERPKSSMKFGKDNPYKDKDPELDTPDLFTGKTKRDELAAAPGVDDLIREHKRLVAVLRSPSHSDDLAEADKQARELREYERASGRSRT